MSKRKTICLQSFASTTGQGINSGREAVNYGTNFPSAIEME